MDRIQWRYIVTCIRGGQPRPYADHEYVHEILCELWSPYGKPEERRVWRPRMLGVEAQKRIVRELAQSFKDNPEWHEPRLVSIHQTQDGVIHSTVTQPYLD